MKAYPWSTQTMAKLHVAEVLMGDNNTGKVLNRKVAEWQILYSGKFSRVAIFMNVGF